MIITLLDLFYLPSLTLTYMWKQGDMLPQFTFEYLNRIYENICFSFIKTLGDRTSTSVPLYAHRAVS